MRGEAEPEARERRTDKNDASSPARSVACVALCVLWLLLLLFAFGYGFRPIVVTASPPERKTMERVDRQMSQMGYEKMSDDGLMEALLPKSLPMGYTVFLREEAPILVRSEETGALAAVLQFRDNTLSYSDDDAASQNLYSRLEQASASLGLHCEISLEEDGRYVLRGSGETLSKQRQFEIAVLIYGQTDLVPEVTLSSV